MVSLPKEISKIGLIVPVYNVEKTIAKVINSVCSYLSDKEFEMLIIDNDSTDGTTKIIETHLAKNSKFSENVTFIKHENNYGYGCSIKAGFDYFIPREVSHVAVIHGDHQVNPSWLLEELVNNVSSRSDIDLAMASRFAPESDNREYSVLRKLGNYFFNRVTTFCSGYHMSDAGAAMMIVRKSILGEVPYKNLTNSWQFHPQLNILLYSIPNIKIKEFPMNWTDSEAESTVPLFRYGISLLRMLSLYWLRKNILKAPVDRRFSHDPIPPNRKITKLHPTGKPSKGCAS